MHDHGCQRQHGHQSCQRHLKYSNGRENNNILFEEQFFAKRSRRARVLLGMLPDDAGHLQDLEIDVVLEQSLALDLDRPVGHGQLM